MNITYIYTPILCCSTSIWHLPSRGTVYMQTKWLFRWKISAIAFYLGRLGFKPLIRSQVKISLVLLSYLTFVHFTQLLPIQAVPDVTSSPCSKGYRGEGYCQPAIEVHSQEHGRKRMQKARRKNREELKVLIVFCLFVCFLFSVLKITFIPFSLFF